MTELYSVEQLTINFSAIVHNVIQTKSEVLHIVTILFCAMLFVPPKSDPLFFFKEQNKL